MKSDRIKLVFASHNAHKLEEVHKIIGKELFELTSLTDIGFHDDIIEDAPNLEGNALIKSRTVYNYCGQSVFSDDTGLEVFALDMEPGVHTARYAGDQKDPGANMNLLLERMLNHEDRRARFRTVVALIYKGEEHLFEGIVNGTIAKDISGSEGFGYDPIFIPEGYSKTFADMPQEFKNSMSHRYRAIEKMSLYFKTNKKG